MNMFAGAENVTFNGRIWSQGISHGEMIRDGFDHRQHQPEATALAILDRRFAEGALSLDEYRQRRDVLTGPAPHPASDAGTGNTGRSER